LRSDVRFTRSSSENRQRAVVFGVRALRVFVQHAVHESTWDVRSDGSIRDRV
jgi:hypothetical protein